MASSSQVKHYDAEKYEKVQTCVICVWNHGHGGDYGDCDGDDDYCGDCGDYCGDCGDYFGNHTLPT
ncbi:unnamed protein product, partial [Didymodactylos carnosus]